MKKNIIKIFVLLLIFSYSANTYAEDINKKVEDLISKLSMDNPSIERSKAAEEIINIGARAVPVLIKQLDDKSLHRGFIIAILGAIGDPTAIPVIKKYINDEDESIRWPAIEALAKIGNNESIGVLLNLYKNPDSDSLDVYYAAQSLRKCTKATGVSTLIKAAEDDSPTIVRGGTVRWTSNLAIEVLGNIKEKSAVPVLIKAIKKSKHQSVRGTALEALAKIDEKEAIKELKESSKNDPSDSIRELARDDLKRIENKNKKGN